MIATPIGTEQGISGEASSSSKKAMAAGVVDVSKSPFKEEMEQAKRSRPVRPQASTPRPQRRLSAPTAKAALANGDLLYGYGQYAKAAELYRAALKKPGADARLINLHLGMALGTGGRQGGCDRRAQRRDRAARAEIAQILARHTCRRRPERSALGQGAGCPAPYFRYNTTV